MARNNRRPEISGAGAALDALKLEVATELGIPNYDQLDKGDLPARVHGKIGGGMVRKLISYAEQQMAKDGQAAVANVQAANNMNNQDINTVQGYAASNGTNLQ